jgi:RecA/RadA recombinase
MGLNADNCIIEYATYLEDIFKKIDRYLADLGNGSLPTDIMIFVDSIGNTLSVDSVTSNKDGTMEIGGGLMKAARTLREQMRVYSHRINDTRKMSSPYTAGLVFINHAYKQPPAFPGGPTTLVPYGGDGIYFASSLVLRTQKKQRLTAVHEGRNINYGIVTKLTVDKNHISNISNAGEFVITSNSIIPNEPEALKEFKDANKVNWNAETINKDE